ncbi:MAG: hypothetical protein DIJKHBIC_00546 [Thermoanaerobaculia bacterium]|nr:hypothetical protein [Thermoanaerobaculia bacterium]
MSRFLTVSWYSVTTLFPGSLSVYDADGFNTTVLGLALVTKSSISHPDVTCVGQNISGVCEHPLVIPS